MSETPLKRLARGLALDGFKLRHAASGPMFRGTVRVGGRDVALCLAYQGDGFTQPPGIRVENAEVLGPGVLAHLDEKNDLCVVDPRAYVVDRYALAEQARGLVRRAVEVLERGLSKAAVDDIAEEFPRHWGGNSVRVAFGPGARFAKPAAGETWTRFVACDAPARPPETGAVVVRTDHRLSFRRDQGRPSTLGEALVWARAWDPPMAEAILAGLAKQSPYDPYVIIQAPNGVVAFQVKVSARGDKVMRALRNGWRSLLCGKFGQALPIVRTQGFRVDTDYVLGTNSMTGTAPLAGRRVLLVGCGAIGGYLSTALAQLGAGFGGGALILIDDEILTSRNTARHRLGVESVDINKAVACKRSIDVAWPGGAVSALPMKIEQCRARVLAADLVIDATGEQAVGDLLNAWFLETRDEGVPGRALLHVWVAGNGAAVQSYISSSPEHGCYRCLQPDLLQPPRFAVMRADADQPMATGCGEAPFSPYGPAAPMAAAALAAQHALDWSSGAVKTLLRTVRLSYDETVERKPTNPTRSDQCPACAHLG